LFLWADLRKTKEVWPLPTVDTEANGDSRSTCERGPFYWLVHRAGARDFGPALAALVGPVQNIFSSPNTISLHLCPTPSKLGRQSCRVACLLVSLGPIDRIGSPLYPSKDSSLVWAKLEVKRIDFPFIQLRTFLMEFSRKSDVGGERGRREIHC